MSGHRLGVPSWVELSSPDLVASARFYGGLFGWDAATRTTADYASGQLAFQLDGVDIAGLIPVQLDDKPSWTTYIEVSDADELERNVSMNGGDTLAAAKDIAGAGPVALFSDPLGAVLGVWQRSKNSGEVRVGAMGSAYWAQLVTRQVDVAKRFYSSVFDWLGFTSPYATSTYTRFHLDGRDVAGMIEMDRTWPENLPAHWLPFFAVEDCEQVAERAGELGGEVPVEPYDMVDMGRAAVLGDPHGAVFAIIEPDVSFAGLKAEARDDAELTELEKEIGEDGDEPAKRRPSSRRSSTTKSNGSARARKSTTRSRRASSRTKR